MFRRHNTAIKKVPAHTRCRCLRYQHIQSLVFSYKSCDQNKESVMREGNDVLFK